MLPDSEEAKYLSKCQDLKRRIREVEEHNETMVVSISRTKRAIQRLRLERAFLLEKLEERTLIKVEDSDGTVSAPGSPVIEHTKTGRRKAAPRDPDLPKRPQNPYIIFCEREKERVKADLEATRPGETVDLTKAMAEAWKELGNAGRKPFQALYEEDRKRYLREMAAWESPTASEAGLREKRRAQKALRELEEVAASKNDGEDFDGEDAKDEELSELDDAADDEDVESSRIGAHTPPSEAPLPPSLSVPDPQPAPPIQQLGSDPDYGRGAPRDPLMSSVSASPPAPPPPQPLQPPVHSSPPPQGRYTLPPLQPLHGPPVPHMMPGSSFPPPVQPFGTLPPGAQPPQQQQPPQQPDMYPRPQQQQQQQQQ